MSPFWCLWAAVAAMVAIAVPLWLRAFASGDPRCPAGPPARALLGLVGALFCSLLLRVFDLVLVPCLLLAAAAVAAVAAVLPQRPRVSSRP